MTITDWISCSIAFIALLLSIPSFIHTINARLKLSVSITDIHKRTKADRFAYYFTFNFANSNSINLTIISVEIYAEKAFKNMTNQFGKKTSIILSQDLPTCETDYYIADLNPFYKKGRVKVKINTNLKSFIIKLNVGHLLN